MIGYAMLGTNDLARARRFYAPLVAMLGGAEIPVEDPHRRSFYGRPRGPALAITEPVDGAPATVGNGSMLALPVATRAEVDAVHAKALELGAADEGAPGVRGRSGPEPTDPPFYGAYFRDLDGNKLCIFHIGPD